MKRIYPPLVCLLGIAFALPILAASAQTPPAGAIPNISEFEGIEAAISRTWSLDVEGMIAATPDIEPDDFDQGVTALSAMVLRFDTAEQARAGYDAFLAGMDVELLDMAQAGTPTVTDEPVDDLGDTASAITLNTSTEDQETFFRFVLVHHGEYFFLTSALAATSDVVVVADELAAYLVNDGEDQGDEANFVAEGTSSGGLWGLMPTEDNELLGGLIPIFDETLFPAP
jgi:hypothetical protein